MEHVVRVIWEDGTENVYPASDIIDADEIRDRITSAGGDRIEWCGIETVTYEEWTEAFYRR